MSLVLGHQPLECCRPDGRQSQHRPGSARRSGGYGVSVDPTVFINGRPVLGAAPIGLFINDELERAGR